MVNIVRNKVFHITKQSENTLAKEDFISFLGKQFFGGAIRILGDTTLTGKALEEVLEEVLEESALMIPVQGQVQVQVTCNKIQKKH